MCVCDARCHPIHSHTQRPLIGQRMYRGTCAPPIHSHTTYYNIATYVPGASSRNLYIRTRRHHIGPRLYRGHSRLCRGHLSTTYKLTHEVRMYGHVCALLYYPIRLTDFIRMIAALVPNSAADCRKRQRVESAAASPVEATAAAAGSCKYDDHHLGRIGEIFEIMIRTNGCFTHAVK